MQTNEALLLKTKGYTSKTLKVKGFKCYNCDEIDHFTKQCKKLKKQRDVNNHKVNHKKNKKQANLATHLVES